MASTMARLLLAASLLVANVQAYKAEVFGPLIAAALDSRPAEVGGTTQATPGSVPGGINFQEGAKANVTALTPQYFQNLGSQRAELRYGPFEAQGMQLGNGMVDYLQIGAQMPCSNCTLTFIQAELEYPDGSYANANTSLWLHHTVFIKLGTPDTVCGLKYYAQGQRWFASGNERTPAALSLDGLIPAGYYLGEHDIHMILLEIMNQAMVEQQAVLSITYEWVPGSPDDIGFYPITPVWLDIAGCMGASDEPAIGDGAFHYDSPTYSSNITGALIGTGAHLHDGGVYADIVMNDTVQCQSQAFYGQTDGYWDRAGEPMSMNPTAMASQMSMGSMRMPHISFMGRCIAPSAMVNLHDNWGVNAYYNFTEYSPMLNSDGSVADVMGISIMYVAANMTKETMQSYAGTAPQTVFPNGTYVPHLTPESPNADMTCVPMRDSPGSLTGLGLNFTDYDTSMLYLMSILDDACLSTWGAVWALGYTYGIVGAIVLAAIFQRGQMLALLMRKRSATKNGARSSWNRNGIFPHIASLFRAVGYRQYTPTFMPNVLRIPNVGMIVTILGYLGFTMLMCFVNRPPRDDQYWQNLGVRAAWVSVAQVPIIILLATKRNFVGLVTAVTYERLNVLHRWTARGLLLTATLHFAFQSYGWWRLGLMTLEWSTDLCPPTGIAAYALLLWMNLTTLAPFRALCYEFFVIQHVITFFGLIIAITYHIPDTALNARNYIYAGIVLYFVAKVVQIGIYIYRNVRPGRASISPASNNVTKITLSNRTIKKWTPGSHVYLRFPGFWFWQSHPATIASTPESNDGELVFFFHAHKGFSRNLHKAALECDPTVSKSVLIDGPYGGLQPDFAAFATTVLIASSTGISFTLPILLDLAERAATGQTLPVRRIEFTWAIKDGDCTSWVRSELTGALTALRAAKIPVNANIHVTGLYEGADEKSLGSGVVSSGSDSDSTSGEKDKKDVRVQVTRQTSWDHELVPITRGRCDVPGLLRRLKSDAEGEMGVAVCGSLELAKEVRNTVAGLQAGKGAFLHVEGFGW